MALYVEPMDAGNEYRRQLLTELEALILEEQEAADRRREAFFSPDRTSVAAYEKSTQSLRRAFVNMLGWPLTLYRRRPVPKAQVEFVATDELGEIHRIRVETLPGLHMYGLLFLPPGTGPHALVISQHGGGGTPELCSGLDGNSFNYNDMTRRVLRRGCAVFAPQMLLWGEDRGPKHDRQWQDRRLKNLGGSLAALEMYGLRRCLDYLAARKDIDAARIGMIGLSYGGFYTLFAAAVEPRIRVAVSSCFFNSRRRYDWPDWTWFESMNRFQDAEAAQLVCPRALYVEVGARDELFDVRSAGPEADKVRRVYEALGIADRFVYREHPGGHELDKGDEGIEFLIRHLGETPST